MGKGFNGLTGNQAPGPGELDPADQARRLAMWRDTAFGAYLLAEEQDTVAEVMSQTTGYRAMLLRVLDSPVGLAGGSQLHQFVIAPWAGEGVAAVGDYDALPLPSSVVDVAVLHHVLDFCEFPHEALKEAGRVVLPYGSIVIVGFSPWSWFGLVRVFARLFRLGVVWQCRCLSAGRISDWLRLLGFQPEIVHYGACRPPLQSQRVLHSLSFFDRLCRTLRLPLGGYYVIVAKKMRLRPVRGRPEWLAKAINPVKLASKSPVESNKNGH